MAVEDLPAAPLPERQRQQEEAGAGGRRTDKQGRRLEVYNEVLGRLRPPGPRRSAQIEMEYEGKCRKDQRLKCDYLVFDLDDTLYPMTSVIGADVMKNIQDYMVQKLGVEESISLELCILLYKQYGTTMAGLRAVGYQFDYDDYHRYLILPKFDVCCLPSAIRTHEITPFPTSASPSPHRHHRARLPLRSMAVEDPPAAPVPERQRQQGEAESRYRRLHAKRLAADASILAGSNAACPRR